MRNPLVSVYSEELTNENRNTISQQYYDIFETICGHDIFPPTYRQYRFSIKDSPLYVFDRKWVQENAINNFKPKSKQQFEEYVHYLFWKEQEYKNNGLEWSHTFQKKIVFILGTLGCGKSTFIDYYLRCYCPENSDTQKQIDFEKKIIIRIDFGGFRENTEAFFQVFNSKARIAIEECCERWDIDINSLIEKKYQKSSNSFNDSEWVDRALRIISPKTNRHSNNMDGSINESKYIVIFIDNLDQASGSIQKHALNLVGNWLEDASAFNIWKVFIPLWPNTLDRIKNLVGRLPEHETVKLTPCNPNIVYEKRIKEVIELIKIREISFPFKFHSSNTSTWFLEHIRKEISTGVEDFEASEHSFLYNTISNITNFDFRHSLLMLRDFACNFELYELFRLRGHSKFDFKKYITQCALLAGRFRYYNRNESQIMNIFDVFRDVDFINYDHYSMIIGYHLLSLLNIGIKSRNQLKRTLTDFGYNELSIDNALSHFLKFNFYHDLVAQEGHKDTELTQHSFVVNQYLELIKQPSYIDSMAIVTPISEYFLKSMIPTAFSNPGQFKHRVETSILFLTQLKNDETIVYYDNKSIIKDDIPFLYLNASKKYIERLEGLKSEYEYPEITPNWWEDKLNELNNLCC